MHWKEEPEDHDYPAAQAYLSLLVAPARAAELVEELRKAPLEHRKAKDILRASALQVLPATNFHVHKDLEKVAKKEKLSPVLLVVSDWHLVIADGYHRVCASYHLNEVTDIPCKLVYL